MPEWAIITLSGGGGAIVLIAVFGAIFRWGRRVGTTNNRLNHLDQRTIHEQILPECNKQFDQIKDNIAEVKTNTAHVKGKIDVMLVMMTENQKNDEKYHMRRGNV